MKEQNTENTSKGIRRIPCEVYSRIVGYLRPVQDWNEGKQQEFSERHTYTLDDAASPSVPADEKAGVSSESVRPS